MFKAIKSKSEFEELNEVEIKARQAYGDRFNLFLKKIIQKNATSFSQELIAPNGKEYSNTSISKIISGFIPVPNWIAKYLILKYFLNQKWLETGEGEMQLKNVGLSLEDKIAKLERELLATNSLLDEAGKLIHDLLQRVGDLEEGISHSTSNTSKKIASGARSAQKAKSKH